MSKKLSCFLAVGLLALSANTASAAEFYWHGANLSGSDTNHGEATRGKVHLNVKHSVVPMIRVYPHQSSSCSFNSCTARKGKSTICSFGEIRWTPGYPGGRWNAYVRRGTRVVTATCGGKTKRFYFHWGRSASKMAHRNTRRIANLNNQMGSMANYSVNTRRMAENNTKEVRKLRKKRFGFGVGGSSLMDVRLELSGMFIEEGIFRFGMRLGYAFGVTTVSSTSLTKNLNHDRHLVSGSFEVHIGVEWLRFVMNLGGGYSIWSSPNAVLSQSPLTVVAGSNGRGGFLDWRAGLIVAIPLRPVNIEFLAVYTGAVFIEGGLTVGSARNEMVTNHAFLGMLQLGF